MKSRNLFRPLLVLVTCLALAITIKAQLPSPTMGNPGIVSRDGTVLGLTYEQWSARWWQFVYGIPADQNPLLAGANYDCSIGQSGSVWFLTGMWGQPPIIATRTCTVPKGTYLFFPVANNQYDNSLIGPNGALDWTDYSTEYMRKSLDEQMDSVVGMRCLIDNRDVRHLESARGAVYRVVSPVFHYWLPPNNIFGITVPDPPGTTGIPGVVGDGVYLMLEPLSPGSHTIEFAASFGTAADAYRFDITYLIQVPN